MRHVILASARLARRHRRAATLALYGSVAATGYICAYLLRFGFDVPAAYARIQGSSLLVLVVLRLVSFAACRLDRVTLRFAGTGDVVRLGMASVAGTLAFLILSEAGLFGIVVPHLIVLLEAGITMNLTAAGWLYFRVSYEAGRTHENAAHPKRALIIGAGEAGHLLAHEIQRSPLGYRLIGFIDDDPEISHTDMCGTEVLGTTADLQRIVVETAADELLISQIWSDPKSFRETIALCQRTGLPIKVLPDFSDVVKGDGLVERLRAVRVEDLLGRSPVQLALPELAVQLDAVSVLITGAAGSIGSELARQVALHRPGTLVLFDHDETQLFYLEMELREQYPDVPLVPLIGDITDATAVERAFRCYRPDWVFHAAAYKHVPMMESNAREAIRNNLIATHLLATTAARHAVRKFVFMSTDKAVKPCSVMGATKRLAELAILELQQVYDDTAFCAVRFGNVLGSKGSVLPIFERQLAAGRLLTVTHPEATRYFMTIPEAVQLILQASILDDIKGRVAMLEMGSPIRILEMAQNFLRLAGRADVSGIVFTGLRPGERLHEELISPDELTVETSIPKVRLVITPAASAGEMQRIVTRWADQLEAGDEADVLRQLGHRFPDLQLPATMAAHLSISGRTPRTRHAAAHVFHFNADPDES